MLPKLREFFWVAFLPISFLWACVSVVRRKLLGSLGYRSKFLVICVGNLHSGGSGKTPIVAEIASHFTQKNVVILSRGYKRQSKAAVLELSDTPEGSFYYGDEPWLLFKKTNRPVFVGASRARVTQNIEKKYPEALLLMDDGFQHLSLKKDISILVIHTQNAFLDSFCLPLGDLREPLSAVKSADCVVLVPGTDVENQAVWRTYFTERYSSLPLFEAETKSVNLCGEKGSKAFIFSGIAKPRSFAHSVEAQGLGKLEKIFPDHHPYSEADIERLIEDKKKKQADYFLTTEKDFYKVALRLSSRGEKLAYLEHRVLLPEPFWNFLEEKLGAAA